MHSKDYLNICWFA